MQRQLKCWLARFFLPSSNQKRRIIFLRNIPAARHFIPYHNIWISEQNSSFSKEIITASGVFIFLFEIRSRSSIIYSLYVIKTMKINTKSLLIKKSLLTIFITHKIFIKIFFYTIYSLLYIFINRNIFIKIIINHKI